MRCSGIGGVGVCPPKACVNPVCTERGVKEDRNSRTCEIGAHHFTLVRNPRKHCVSNTDAPVAQLDRAPPSGGGGHTFESCRVRHCPILYDVAAVDAQQSIGCCRMYAI